MNKRKMTLVLLLLAFLLLACMNGIVGVFVDCPGTEDDYQVCSFCTLEDDWVVGDIRYFLVLDNGQCIQHETRKECRVYER